MPQKCRNGLETVENARISRPPSNRVRLGEKRLAELEALKAHTRRVLGQISRLAATIVACTMEGAYRRPELGLLREWAQTWVLLHQLVEFAANVVPHCSRDILEHLH